MDVYSDANSAFAGNQALGAGYAAAIVSTGSSIAGTYLFIDNGEAGFQKNSDLIVNITGYSGVISSVNGNISVNSLFV